MKYFIEHFVFEGLQVFGVPEPTSQKWLPWL